MDYLTRILKTFFIITILSVLNLSVSFATQGTELSQVRPTIFFDLGNTLIDATNIKEIKYFPHAKAYVEELKASGFRVGLMTNIPEKWGKTYEEKIATLKMFIADNWVGDVQFDWDIYDSILIPMKDAQRKPDPYLYKQAIATSPNCPMAYISENPKEVAMAKVLGFVTYNVAERLKVNYLPEYVLKARMQDTFNNRYNKHCFDHIND